MKRALGFTFALIMTLNMLTFPAAAAIDTKNTVSIYEILSEFDLNPSLASTANVVHFQSSSRAGSGAMQALSVVEEKADGEIIAWMFMGIDSQGSFMQANVSTSSDTYSFDRRPALTGNWPSNIIIAVGYSFYQDNENGEQFYRPYRIVGGWQSEYYNSVAMGIRYNVTGPMVAYPSCLTSSPLLTPTNGTHQVKDSRMSVSGETWSYTNTLANKAFCSYGGNINATLQVVVQIGSVQYTGTASDVMPPNHWG